VPTILVLVKLYPLVVADDLIEFHNSTAPVTTMIIPVPPNDKPLGTPIALERI
jgi:hypothetical protein